MTNAIPIESPPFSIAGDFLRELFKMALPDCTYNPDDFSNVMIYSPGFFPSGLPQCLQDHVKKGSASSVLTNEGVLAILFNPDIYDDKTSFGQLVFSLIHEVVEAGLVTDLPDENYCRDLFNAVRGISASTQNPEVVERLNDFDHFQAVWTEFMVAGRIYDGDEGIQELLDSKGEYIAKLHPWLSDMSAHPDGFLAKLIAESVRSLF